MFAVLSLKAKIIPTVAFSVLALAETAVTMSGGESIAWVKDIGSLGILAWIMYYLFRTALPELVKQHRTEFEAQRALFVAERAADQLRYTAERTADQTRYAAERVADQARYADERKSNQGAYLSAIADQRHDFTKVMDAKAEAIDSLKLVVEKLVDVVSDHDRTMRDAHRQETRELVLAMNKAADSHNRPTIDPFTNDVADDREVKPKQP